MTKADFYSIFLKLLGIFFLYRFVTYLKEFAFMLVANNWQFGDLNIALYTNFSFSILIELFFGLIFIFKTATIVSWISNGKEDKTSIVAPHRKDIMEAGIAILSVIMISYSTAGLISYFVESTYFHDPKESKYFTGSNVRLIFYEAFKLISGIFIMLNARYFASLFVKRGDLSDEKENEN